MMKVDSFNIDQYFKRLDFNGSKSPTVETLNKLCWCHATKIPLETLDLFNDEEKTLDLYKIYENIVIKNRGGWCYELNGVFALLLQALEYEVELLEGSCFMPGRDQFSFPFNHLLLKVLVEGNEYIVDVGYGAPSFFEPMLFNFTSQTQMTGIYRIRKVEDNEYYVEKCRKKVINALTGEEIIRPISPSKYAVSDEWEIIFRFSGLPRQWSDYETACLNHQTDEDGFFTNNSFLEIFHNKGADVLWGTKLIERRFPDPMTEVIKIVEMLPDVEAAQADDVQKQKLINFIKTKFRVELTFWPKFMSKTFKMPLQSRIMTMQNFE